MCIPTGKSHKKAGAVSWQMFCGFAWPWAVCCEDKHPVGSLQAAFKNVQFGWSAGKHPEATPRPCQWARLIPPILYFKFDCSLGPVVCHMALVIAVCVCILTWCICIRAMLWTIISEIRYHKRSKNLNYMEAVICSRTQSFTKVNKPYVDSLKCS